MLCCVCSVLRSVNALILQSEISISYYFTLYYIYFITIVFSSFFFCGIQICNLLLLISYYHTVRRSWHIKRFLSTTTALSFVTSIIFHDEEGQAEFKTGRSGNRRFIWFFSTWSELNSFFPHSAMPALRESSFFSKAEESQQFIRVIDLLARTYIRVFLRARTRYWSMNDANRSFCIVLVYITFAWFFKWKRKCIFLFIIALFGKSFFKYSKLAVASSAKTELFFTC